MLHKQFECSDHSAAGQRQDRDHDVPGAESEETCTFAVAELDYFATPGPLTALISQQASTVRAYSADAENRDVGTCRHYAVLTTAMLRASGVPARARCGFASYFVPMKYVAHWVTEYWGAGEIRGNIIRDVAALMKIEMLPWENWGFMEASYDVETGDDFDQLMDHAAVASAANDRSRVEHTYSELAVPDEMIV